VNTTGLSTAALSVAASRALQAGNEGSSLIYVCVGYITSTGEVLPGKWESNWGFCDIPLVSNGTEIEYNDNTYALLMLSPWLIWSSTVPQGTLANAQPVIPGMYRNKNVTICRAYHPTQRTGPHAGYTDGTKVTVEGSGLLQTACIFSYGGKAVHAPLFDSLYLLPANADLSVISNYTTNIIQPSTSPTPSGTPTNSPSTSPGVPMTDPLWLTESAAFAAGYGYTGYVKAGTEGFNNDIYVCRGTLASGDVISGKWESNWGFCDIPVNGTEYNDVTFQLLIRNPYLQWSSNVLPGVGTPVRAGTYQGLNVTVCRSWHPVQRTGPHAGYTTFALVAGAPVCIFSWGGTTVSSYSFDILVSISLTDVVNTTAVLPQPSATPTPTGTPTPSPSMPAPSPGQVQWLTGNVEAVQAGIDGTTPVYVCRGSLPTGEIIPGKWLPGFTFCDIAAYGKEVNDPNYELLRSNVRLNWVKWNETSSVPSGGKAITGGLYQGLTTYVCRAYHPIDNSGPHAGYTDLEIYNTAPLCFYSYGGKTYRVAPFDLLYMYPAPSASPSATRSPIPTSTSTATGSNSPTPSTTKSLSTTSTPSGPASFSSTKTSTGTSTSTATGTSTGTSTATRSATASSTATPSMTASISITPTGSKTPPVPIAYRAPETLVNPGGVIMGTMFGILVAVLGVVVLRRRTTTRYTNMDDNHHHPTVIHVPNNNTGTVQRPHTV